MIDIESRIIKIVSTAVSSYTPTVTISSENIYESDATYPLVIIREISNTSYPRTMTQETSESFAKVAYDINAYSNKSEGGRRECRNILALIDVAMLNAGFIRISFGDISNVQNLEIARMVARYEAVVSANYEIYRR